MSRVEIYTKGYCGFCHRAKALLDQRGIEYKEYDITRDADGQEEMIERAEGRRSVPQVFIDGELIGGSDELAAYDRSGELEKRLSA